MVPCLQNLGINTERSDAGGSHIFVPGFGHKGKMSGDYRHDCLCRNDVRVIANPGASRVSRIINNIFRQFILHNIQVSPFRTREESLADTTSRVKIAIISYLFLIILPYLLFTL